MGRANRHILLAGGEEDIYITHFFSKKSEIRRGKEKKRKERKHDVEEERDIIYGSKKLGQGPF